MEKDGMDILAQINPFAALIGMKLGAWEGGECVCTLDVRPQLLNPGQVLHGGAAFAMADTTMAMAIIPLLEPGQVPSTIEIKISYLATVRKGTLVCRSKLVRRGKNIAFLESYVHADDQLVATATGTFAIIAVGRE